ncbi:specifically androgen-regulated gene protein [Centroberyx gerrardi]
MPKSDTWPGGIGLETMTGMDSAGSCDSVVSANSGFSDDSLEHLSAEEKACLMFLEETIESLDTEEDSGLSNDEPDQLPVSGNLATKLADLSASMSTSKLNSSPKHASKEAITENFKDHKPMQSYMVPTPFVMANSSPCSVPNAMPGFPPDKKNFHPKPQSTTSRNEPGPQHNKHHGAPQVPAEVNVVVIPPPAKPKDCSVRTAEGPSPRGPLSYEALVHLRRSASAKKSPLCPTIDHTIDSAKYPAATNHGNLSRSLSEASKQEPRRPKTSPPVVLPKPKTIPANISVRIQNETAHSTPDSSSSGMRMADPQKVRLEALQKLGLLKDKVPENEEIAPLSHPKFHSPWDLSHNRFVRDPSHANPSRSPSFSYSQVSTEPKNRPVQSSASFHHYSRREQQEFASLSHPSQPNGVKAATLERSGVGLGSYVPCEPTPQPRSATLGSHRNGGPEPEPVKTTSAAQPAPHKASNPVGYSVMMVPGMGVDRKEALRKLGLLKD